MKSEMKSPAQKGVAFLEFAIIAPLLFFVVLGMIDLFTYLYLANVLDARAHRALEVASWVPGLEQQKEVMANGQESALQKASRQIKQNVLSSEISTLFKTAPNGPARARLLGEEYSDYAEIVEIREGQEIDKETFRKVKKDIVIALPPVQAGSKTRDIYFSRNPIGVRINAKINPLTPFMPSLDVSGEAWGFRETSSTSERSPMIDCTGKPFDPNKLPTPQECCLDAAGKITNGINPYTGLCGCPSGREFGIIPGKVPEESACICKLSSITCDNGKPITHPDNWNRTVNYNDCTCSPGDCTYDNWQIGAGRDGSDPGKCSCTQGEYFLQGFGDQVVSPIATGGCAYQNCEEVTTSRGAKYQKCTNRVDPTCKVTCPKNSGYDPILCGCYCSNGGNDLAPPGGCGCNILQTDVSNTPGKLDCHCQKNGVDMPAWDPERGVLDPNTCSYVCNNRVYYSGTSYQLIPGDPSIGTPAMCKCAAGYTNVKNGWGGQFANSETIDPNSGSMCCKADMCTTGEWAGASNVSLAWFNTCYCKCAAGTTPVTIESCCMPLIDSTDPTKIDTRHCGSAPSCAPKITRDGDNKITKLDKPDNYTFRKDCYSAATCAGKTNEYCKPTS